MLPKEEKIKKSPDEKQPGLFDKEDERKRLAQKRRFVYIALILTVGLSLSFWIYRSVKNFDFSFKLPKLNFTVNSPKSSSIKTTASLTLPKDNSTWSIFLQNPAFESIIYEKNTNLIFNTDNLNSITNQINQANFITSSPYIINLPQGLKVKEIIQDVNNSFSYFSKITTPNQELFLFIKITDSKDLNQAKSFVPDLINQLYWYSLQK